MAKHNELGKQGESIARRYVQENGYDILELNWRFEKSEIDIIAQKEGMIIFIEVKTRSTNHFGYPEKAVHFQKQTKLLQAAEEFLIQKNIFGEIRFDIISITLHRDKPDILHLEDAFFPNQF